MSKLFFLGSLLSIFFYGFINRNELAINNSTGDFLVNEHQLLFNKSNNCEWKTKSIKVSFEDEFENFVFIENLKYGLSNNNLKQGITVKLKIIDHLKKTEKVNEIMIESFALSKGINEFTIAYNDNTPYIIY